MTIKRNIVLGIETSCDDTSISIIEEAASENDLPRVISHFSFGQEELLAQWGGVVPEIAARNHLAKLTPLLKEAFTAAKLAPSDIDYISVTTSPGLLGPLLTGLNAAKTLALIHQKPIISVNHLYAHLEAIHLTDKVEYPYLGLLVSGGHSIFFWVQNKNDFKVLGSTIDDAAGEAFDKGGKLLDLGYPAGKIIDQLATFGDAKKYQFPIGLLGSKDARMSYSGLKTSLRVFLDKNPEILSQRPQQFESLDPKSQDFYDVCASYQAAIVNALTFKAKYAINIAVEKYGAPKKPAIVIGGGVACNTGLRSAFKEKYQKNGLHIVSPKYCTDNGAMIANYGVRNTDLAISFPNCLELDSRGRFINKKDFIKPS